VWRARGRNKTKRKCLILIAKERAQGMQEFGKGVKTETGEKV
jgi:hypothetical protein